MPPAFGLNRFDYSSPAAFAAHARRAEALGYDWAYIPSSPLRRGDPYVMMAFAAEATERISFGPLLENPVVRHPGVVASSIATVDMVAPGRTQLVYGIGDTAVRLLGMRPARLKELEDATILTQRLLRGEAVEVGAQEPARLPHARPVPVWIAAGGPRTLRMAGRIADGVFIRVGTHPENIRISVEAIRKGAVEAGRNPDDVRLAAVFHTALDDNPEVSWRIARSMAAGYYEYSPMLFDQIGFTWNGPPVEELKKQVWPDFHHHPNLEESGAVVDFLPEEAADAFALHGSASQIADQLESIMALGYPFEIIVPQPVLSWANQGMITSDGYMTAIAEGVLSRFR